MAYEDGRNFLFRQFDANASLSPDFDGLGMQPSDWERRAREFQRENLVVTQRAEQFPLTQSKDYTVTIETEPEPFKETAETDPAHVQKYGSRQVTFEPTEFTEGFETSWTNIVRTFISEMDRFTQRLGYASAVAKDREAVQAIYDNADVETIYAGGKANRADLVAGDILTVQLLREVKRKTLRNRYRQRDFIISPEAEEQLLGDTNVSFADRYGGTESIRNGEIGQLAGFNIVVAHSVQLADGGANEDEEGMVSKNIAMGETGTGEAALGHGIIRQLMIETDYDPKYRMFGIYGHEEYDFKVLHSDAIFVVETYNEYAA